jgi:hypothetical protein
MTTISKTADARASRLAAFRAVQGLVARYHGVKLHDDEAQIIEWASEDLLLATDCEQEDVVAAITAFTTLMDDLESGRWEDMVGSEEQPGSAMLLRRAFIACAPGLTD